MPNATLGGAIKTVLEQAGLGLQAFRGVAPARAHLPFCVITEGVSWQNVLSGDTDTHGEMWVREQVQVDIYQSFRSADGTWTEVPDLENVICFELVNTRLPDWADHVVQGARIIARSSQVGDTDDNVKRTIVTLEIDWTFEARMADLIRRQL